MSIWKSATLGVLIPLALATPLMAQGRGAPAEPRMMFETFDLNGDGAITLDEVQGLAAARFAANDADGDGVLSRDELIAAGQARMENRADRMIEQADANGDGALSLEELAGMREGRRGSDPDRMFARMDADDNGSISVEEFEEAAGQFMGRHGVGGRGHGRGHDRG